MRDQNSTKSSDSGIRKSYRILMQVISVLHNDPDAGAGLPVRDDGDGHQCCLRPGDQLQQKSKHDMPSKKWKKNIHNLGIMELQEAEFHKSTAELNITARLTYIYLLIAQYIVLS